MWGGAAIEGSRTGVFGFDGILRRGAGSSLGLFFFIGEKGGDGSG